MSTEANARTHKTRVTAQRKVTGARRTTTHPLRKARRDAAAYRLGNPLPVGGLIPVYADGTLTRLGVMHMDTDRFARTHRTVKVFSR